MTNLYYQNVRDPATQSEYYDDARRTARAAALRKAREAEESAAAAKAAQAQIQLVVPEVYAASYLMSTLALVLPLFSVTRRERLEGSTALGPLGYIEQKWESKNRGSVRYRGPRLTQSHQTLLLTLIKLRSEQKITEQFEVEPRELLKVMGWSDSKARRARLREMLDDLHEARLRVWKWGQDEDAEALRTTLVSGWQPTETGAWRIDLSASCVSLFSGDTTVLNLETRQKLREGVATFVYGYVAANTGVLGNGKRVPYSFRMLHELSGATSKDMGEFGDSVCNALDQLKKLGVVKSYKRENGAVTVYKR